MIFSFQIVFVRQKKKDGQKPEIFGSIDIPIKNIALYRGNLTSSLYSDLHIYQLLLLLYSIVFKVEQQYETILIQYYTVNILTRKKIN